MASAVLGSLAGELPSSLCLGMLSSGQLRSTLTFVGGVQTPAADLILCWAPGPPPPMAVRSPPCFQGPGRCL